jgi:hypothetical protein
MNRPHTPMNRASHLIKTLVPVVLLVLLFALGFAVAACGSSQSTADNTGTQAGQAAGEEVGVATTSESTASVDRAARDAFLQEFFTEDDYTSTAGSGGEESEEIILVTYQVDGGQISSPVEESVAGDLVDLQEDTQTQQEIWEYFVRFMPADERKLISEFVIFTDGAENVLAAADQVSESPEGWSLEIDIVDVADKAELTYNLLHEYAHVLTLNGTQFGTGGDDSSTYQSEDERTAADSYLNLFYQRFWTDIYSEWELAYDEDYLDEFYDEHSDQFLTDYAATEPEEDIAESWLYFIVSERSSGESVADQKMDFFYGFPEMVSVREEIRDNLYQYLLGD